MPREFEVIVWGATGFTGRLITEYIATNYADLRWAIAGRSLDKLEAISSILPVGSNRPAVRACDLKNIGTLVSQTQVVLSAAGPYSRIGAPVVEACLRHTTDYCDITGEIAWVKDLIDLHSETAVARGVILCNMCGFDSIPSDLGAFYAVEELRKVFGKDTEVTKVSSFFKFKGLGISGGSLASGIEMELDPIVSKKMNDPFLLGGRPASGVRDVDAEFKSYRFDSELNAFIAPFMMAKLNTRVVRRSAGILGYGSQFVYQEVAVAKNEDVAKRMALPGPPAAVRAKMVAQGRLPAPGQGPSKEQRAKASFETFIKAECAEGTVWVKVSGGEPGYEETAKMVSESAICLARDRKKLNTQAGVFPPAVVFGSTLIDRLNATGLRFERISKSNL